MYKTLAKVIKTLVYFKQPLVIKLIFTKTVVKTFK